MKHAIVALALIAAALPAQAQVYKCQEGGKTVYSQMPCSPAGEKIDLKVHQPSAADRRRAQAQALSDIESAAVRREYQERADARRESGRTSAAPAPDECEQLQEDHADAKHWSKKFRHPDNIHREQQKAKKAASDSFFRCPPSKRVSVFDQD